MGTDALKVLSLFCSSPSTGILYSFVSNACFFPESLSKSSFGNLSRADVPKTISTNLYELLIFSTT